MWYDNVIYSYCIRLKNLASCFMLQITLCKRTKVVHIVKKNVIDLLSKFKKKAYDGYFLFIFLEHNSIYLPILQQIIQIKKKQKCDSPEFRACNAASS